MILGHLPLLTLLLTVHSFPYLNPRYCLQRLTGLFSPSVGPGELFFLIHLLVLFCFILLETGPHYVALAGLELVM